MEIISKRKNEVVIKRSESNYDYCFIIKELAEEFTKKIYLLKRKHWKKYCFYSFNTKKVTRIYNMEKTIRKMYLTYHNLLIAQDLWQGQYQVLSIIFLKEFIELNINTN